MKKLTHILLLVLTLGATIHASSQVANLQNPFLYQQSGLTYKAVKAQVDSTFQNSTDSIEGNGREKGEHWKHFWNDRASYNYPVGKNEFSGVNELAKLMIDDPNSLCEYSEEFGGNWSSLGPDTLANGLQAIGLVGAIWASPTDSNYILAGSGMGGLWKSVDGGKHWVNITDGANLAGTFGVGSIAVNPTNEDEIWITAPSHFHLQGYEWFSPGYNFGVLHTTDGGGTWDSEPYFWNGNWGLGFMIDKLVYAGNGSLYAFGRRDIGQEIYKYASGFWSSIQSFSTTSDTIITDIDVQPIAPYNLFASTKGIVQGIGKKALLLEYNGSSGILSATHNYTGHSNKFQFINDMSIPTDSLIYFNCWFSSPDSISFVKYNKVTGIYTLLNKQFSSNAIGKLVVSPANRKVIYWGSPQGFGGVTYMSVNEGANFTPISTYWANPTHGDIRDLWLQTSSSVDSGKGDILFIANDGGVAKKPKGKNLTSGGLACENINGRGLSIAQFYGFADQDGEKKLLSGGGMHCGLFACEGDKAVEWTNIAVCDGFESEFDGVDRHRSYYQGWMSYGDRDLRVSDSSLTRKIASQVEYVQQSPTMKFEDKYNVLFPIKYHEESKKLFAGRSRVWVKDTTTLNNGNWKLYGNLPRGYDTGTYNGNHYVDSLEIRAIAVAQYNPNIAYVGYFASKGKGVIQFTIDGGINWTDVTPSDMHISLQWPTTPLTSIACSDKEPNKVWVGKSMIAFNNGEPASVNRVIYSNNYGQLNSWIDLSEGLPPYPVTSLVYQNGSDDVLYAGTDVGVYRFVKQTPIENSYWVCYNDNFPRSLINDLEINYCDSKLRAATHGRGIWESDLYNTVDINNVSLPGATITISSNTTWGTLVATDRFDKYIEGSIIVKSGKTLTIQGVSNLTNNTSTTNIYMPKYGTIYVEKGANLVINGARVSNRCAMWYGIQAYGDGVSPQIMSGSYYPNQGYVELKNGAILENAEEAFSNVGGSDTWNTGGIINANNSVFLNNRRSCQFIKYENKISGTLYRDKSKFIDCKFILDLNHRQPFGNHITMWAVRGIEIKGCSFINGTSLEVSHERAIYTIDGSYDINNSGLNSTTVDGFYTGFHSSSYSWSDKNNFPISIQNANFEKNEISIQLDDMLYPSIVSNNIKVGAKQTPYPSGTGWSYYSLGSHLRNVSHFMYCNNVHTKPYAPPAASGFQYTAGLEIHNSGPDDQQIEKNSYTDLLIGTDIDYTCGSIQNNTGINLRWNKNKDNQKFDFIFQADAIIRSVQSADLTANNVATGNTFSSTAGLVHWRHTPDPGANGPVNYFHASATNETPTNFVNVNPIVASNTQVENPDCEKYTTVHKAKEGNLTNSELAALKSDFYNHEDLYLNYLSLYNQLIDDGETEQTQDEIENSNSSQAMQIRNEMLARSPYVSYDVLYTLCEENVLPQAFLLEILTSNPEATRNETFIRYLQYEKPNPMPAYMIGIIRNSWQGATLRSSLERTLMYEHEQMTKFKDEIIVAYKYMPSFFNNDSLLIWLNKVPSLRTKYEIIENYLYNKNYTYAESILQNLPTQFRMNEQEQEEYTAYQLLYSFKKSLLQSYKEINQLTTAEVTQLQTIADRELNSFSRSMARNALCFFYKICYPETNRALPITENRLSNILKQEDTPKGVIVYPNPANQYAVVQYNFTEKDNNVENLIISELTGKQIYSSNLQGNIGQHIWDVRNVSAGTYVYIVKTKSGEKHTGKIVVIK